MIKRTYIYLLFFLWEYVFYLTLQNGACVKVVEQKNCSVEIKDLSCKEARGNGW